nr:hypothetical protein Hi04_10k_c5966_00005 [uncultured bacterium]
MNKRFVPLAVFTLFFLIATSGVMQASAISGSLPFVIVNASENGTNLLTSTMLFSTGSLTSGSGTGDFSVVPLFTVFTAVTLDTLTVGSGGTFALSNPTYGSFVATSGSIFTRTPTFLDVTLFGIYVPGPAFAGLTASPAEAHVSFNQTGNSLSGSFTLATVPEPGALTLLGSGILVSWHGLRWRRRV